MKIFKLKLYSSILTHFKPIALLFLGCLFVSLSSCKKFLDVNPNDKQVKISTPEDCQALLDDFNTMNAGFPSDGETSADNYYLRDVSWAALASSEDRDFYIWSPSAQRTSSVTQWAPPYKGVYYANLVLQTLEKLTSKDAHVNTLKGSAYFFRANALYHIAQLYAKPYDVATATLDPGVPTRESTDINVESERGTVQQTYDHIVQDLQQAITLLPITSSIKTRPNRVAAFAALARTYLSMENYEKAGIYADSCLKKYNVLIDYNSLTPTLPAPLTIFNDEVIFHANSALNPTLNPSIAKVDSILYKSYDSNDLRRTIFFRANNASSGGGFAFRGSYNGLTSALFFSGLATDEVYLIRAECNARAGKISDALADLNALLIKRWKVNTFVPITAGTVDEALRKILDERRKELIFRTLRWSDLRRLNKDGRFKKDLYRKINGTTYSLPANDLRYTLLIPQDVMNQTNFKQNPR